MIPVQGAAAAGYEVRLRFRDGSTRITSHSGSGAWRVGDTMIFIGGAKVAKAA
jgi:hypothetical protein